MATQLKTNFSSFFEKIGALSKLQRLLICLVTFGIIGGVYYFAVYAPKHEILKNARAEYTKQAALLETTKKHAAELKRFEILMAEAQERFNIAVQALPEQREVPSLLTEVSKAGTSAGIIFHLFQPTAEVTKDFYVEIPVSIKVEGRYHQMTDFFYRIARLNRIVNIHDISMTAKKNMVIDMNCKAVTYMFAEKKEPETAPSKTTRKKR